MSLAVPRQDRVRLYDRLAPHYDRLRRRWLRHVGGEAQVALEATGRALAMPNTNLLDAGCGTGAFAGALIAEGVSPALVTLLDPSDAMLGSAGAPGQRAARGPAVRGWRVRHGHLRLGAGDRT